MENRTTYLLPSNITSVSLWSSFSRHSWKMRKQNIQEPHTSPCKWLANCICFSVAFCTYVGYFERWLCRAIFAVTKSHPHQELSAECLFSLHRVDPSSTLLRCTDRGCSQKQNPQKMEWMWPQQREMRRKEAPQLENSGLGSEESIRREKPASQSVI